MSAELPCPECGADVNVGEFPAFEGFLYTCSECNARLVVWVDTYENPDENKARLEVEESAE